MRWSWSPWAAFWRCFVRVRLSRSGATRAARATGHGTNGGSNSNPMHSKPPSPGPLPRGEGRAGGSSHGPINAQDATGSGSLRAWATGPGTPKDRDELRRPGTTPPGLGPIDGLERDAVSLVGRNDSEGGPDHMLPDEPDRRVNILPLWGLGGPVPRRSGRGSKGVTTPGCVIVQ